MSSMKRDILGTIAVGTLAVVLFTLFMASMVMLGQTAGRKVIAGGAPQPRARAAIDSTAAAVAVADSAPSDSSASGAAPLFGRRMPGPYDGVPVLCYHYLRGPSSPWRVLKVFLYVVLSLPVLDDNETWTVGHGTFAKHMEYLHDEGYETVTLADLTRWQYGRQPLPRKSVVITFDDGDRSVYEYAYPVLRKYGFRATYFVITGHIGKKWHGLDFLSWRELAEMSESGVFEIASHTHDLHYKTGETRREQPVFLAASRGQHRFDGYRRWEDAVRDDLARSRAEVERNVGRPCRYLAWPYGHSDNAADSLAAAAGFERTLLLRDGLNESFVPARGDTLSELARLRVTRFSVTARTSLRSFRMMLSGEYSTAQGY